MNYNPLKHYGRLVVRRLPILLLISLLLTVIVYGVARRMGPTYEVHYSYLISLSTREQPKEYTFDGYYALQATDLFTATLAQWATTPEVVVAAYQDAQIKLPTINPKGLAHAVSAEKTAPQLVELTVRSSKKAEAEKLARGLMTAVQHNIDIYHEQGIPALTFRVVTTSPWTGMTQLNLTVIVVATFIISLLLGINAVVLVESFNTSANL
jgi:capsular polysaccharide biosynthesis protein